MIAQLGSTQDKVGPGGKKVHNMHTGIVSQSFGAVSKNMGSTVTDKNSIFGQRKRGRPSDTVLPTGKKTKTQVMVNEHLFDTLTKFYTQPPEDLLPCDIEDWKKKNVNECIPNVTLIVKNWVDADKNRRPTVTYNGPDDKPVTKYLPVKNYFEDFQEDIKPRMRTILFSWLNEVHTKFKLRETTLWASLQICDMFLGITSVHRNRLQLVGSTCLWIASKYHEIYPPLAKDFVYISDKAFNRSDLIKCEELVCDGLGFQLSTPTVYNFLLRYIKVASYKIQVPRHRNRIKWLTLYAAERIILCVESLHFKPNKLAAGVVCSALGMTGRKWNSQLVNYTGFSVKDLSSITRLVRKTILQFDNEKHKAVINKYTHQDRGRVALLRRKSC